MSPTVLKIIVVVLLLAVIASLTSGLVFLLRDSGNTSAKRTLYTLGIRVALATALLATIGYGIHSGKLGNTAPWAHSATPTASSPKTP
ncbi:DUF2909 domain-containing protein [Teredinibacter turnerae]|uniref:DUF2909 domain-containing protein n=1 Tax=Teredinibacter turnerae TaxID=2426 RepID=UPI000377EC04|nr:DUF2909 domain-containing protein [Teredinibacter turnerae]